MNKPNQTSRRQLKQMVTFGKKLFAVPKVEYDEREAGRKKRKRSKANARQ
jgi:hypothetical protein